MVRTIGSRHFPLKTKGREWNMFMEDKEKISEEGKTRVEKIKEVVHGDKSKGM